MGRSRYRVVWAQAAADDLEEIVAYIAENAPTTAKRILRKLRKRADTLGTSPERGRVVPELAAFGVRSLRELTVRPYRLMYRIEDGDVIVLAVFDGRRDLEEILLERLIRTR